MDERGACLISIYVARDTAQTEAGLSVTVEGQVTAVRPFDGPSHIVIQVPPGDPGFRGVEYGGIWVYLGDALNPLLVPARGDRVRVTGRTNDFFDQRQINRVEAVDIVRRGEPEWQPSLVRPGDVATNGPRAAALEGALVEITNVTVEAVEPLPGPGDFAPNHEFVVDGGLRVNDYLYRRAPALGIGDEAQSIVGVLRLGNADYKLEPRAADDYDPPPDDAAERGRIWIDAPVNVFAGAVFDVRVRLIQGRIEGPVVVDVGFAPANAVRRVDAGALFFSPDTFETGTRVQALREGELTIIAQVEALGAEARVAVDVLSVRQASGLVINEVDYDQPGEDSGDFVEIHNTNPGPVLLTDLVVELVNGGFPNQPVYATYSLADAGEVIPGGGYLIIGPDAVADRAPVGTLRVGGPINGVQNGSPDGVRLVIRPTGEVLDSVSYEGNMPGATEGRTPPFFDEGAMNGGALGRCPNGADTNNNEVDFTLQPAPTPGAPNDCP